MFKKTFTFIAILTFNSAFALGYQPNDVNTFINTGKCPGCDLSMINLTAPMNTMIGTTNNQNFYNNMDLRNADIVGTSFSSAANLQNSNFTGISGANVSFAYTQLSGSIFVNAILENASFGNANLSNTDFTGADMKGANVNFANLVGAKISAQQLSEMTHCNTILPNGTISQSCTGMQ